MNEDPAPIAFDVTLEKHEIRSLVNSYLVSGPNARWYAYCGVALLVTTILGARDLMANDLPHGIFEGAFALVVLRYLATSPGRSIATVIRRLAGREPLSYVFSASGVVVSDAAESVTSTVRWNAIAGYVRRPAAYVFLLGRATAIVPIRSIPPERATDFGLLLARHSRPVRRYPAL